MALHKGIGKMVEAQCDIEHNILETISCKNCGEPLCFEECADIDLRMIFDIQFCSQGCSAEYHGYRGDAIL